MSSVKANSSKTPKKATTSSSKNSSTQSNNVFVGMNKVWWVPDETQVWALANQISAELPNGLINFEIISNGKTVSHPSHRCLAATNHVTSNANPEDLVLLPDVNQASILACTRERFNSKKIYTSMGVVLMVVNPFEFINGLYGEDVISQYIDPKKKGLASHVYMVPSRAYNNMCTTGKSQSILISGESGAGKTEATKQCLSFLTFVADVAKKPTNSRLSMIFTTLNEGEIADRIIAASPILEAFGNAQTSRNPNSSRFGKWMVLNFDESNYIRSSSIISYLLEKSRVTQRDSKERNYHIFYQIIKGISPSELKAFNIVPDVQNYRYLQSAQQPQDLNDSRSYSHTYESFIKMGFPEEEIKHIIRIVSAILLLGNITFISVEDGEASEVANLEHLNHVATALHVDPLILKYALCNRTIESGKRSKSMITIKLNAAKAAEGRDSLARAIYDKLFIDIIANINKNSHSEDNFDGNMADRSIGLLDIFGFEIFVENSFEQICINYCNERLQNHFNYVIFTAEKALYSSENIVCDTIEFKDNIDVIRDIEMLFKSLDEEGKIPKGTSDTWFHKLKRGPKCITISYPTKRSNNVFTVKHYAGDVDYNSFNCLEKNVETLSNDLIGAMSASTDMIIHRIFGLHNDTAATPTDIRGSISIPSLKDKGNTGQQPQRRASISSIANRSICWKFQHQLVTLMTMLKTTESHFIRCVKSNNVCEPQNFDSTLVHKQLVYSGVFEVVRIQQSGLPCRIPHHDFLLRYRCLAPNDIKYTIASARELISYLKNNEYDLPLAQMGLTMTFYKGQEQRVLEQSRDSLFNITITKLQSFLRKNLMECIFKVFISEFKSFWINCNNFDLAAAHENCKILHAVNDTYKKVLKRDVLSRAINEVNNEYTILQSRVALINEAADALATHSLEHILSLERIINNSNHLDMTHHHLVKECATKWSQYNDALLFAENITDDILITNLSMNEITTGVDNINKFVTIISSATKVINKATDHKKIVQYEINNIFLPMEKLFFDCSIVYDARVGSLVYCNSDNIENLNSLKQIIMSYQSTRFQCKDVSSLYKDCTDFIYILERFLPYNNGVDALQFIKELTPINVTFIQQLSEIKKWAEFQMAPVYFQDYLKNGFIPNTENGSEQSVDTSQISDLLQLLKQLDSPSLIMSNLLAAVNWIVKLRQSFVDQDWTELEKLSDECVIENEKGLFTDYPGCLVDLYNSQWQIIYHGLLSDVLYILSEPIFASIQLDFDDWDGLLTNISENTEALESSKSFAHEQNSPKLYALIPLLENVLQLRSLMYSKDIIHCKSITSSFKTKYAQIISEHQLNVVLDEEIRKCDILIKKIEYEINLNATLDIASVKPYSYTGPNEQPLYSTFCSLEEPIQSLSASIKNFVELGDSFNTSLQRRINLARFILEGRILLNKSEIDDNIKWDENLIEYENKIMEACSQDQVDKIEDTPVTSTPYDNVCIPYFFIPEYNSTVDEFIRRFILSGLRRILKEACIKGNIDIDINVDESKMVGQYLQFNRLSLVMKDKIDCLPENLKCLHNFTSSVLTLRKLVLEKQWFTSVDTFGMNSREQQTENSANAVSFVNDSPIKIMLGQLRTMFHGGGLIITEVHNEIEMTWGEFRAKESSHSLKNALESIVVSIGSENELNYKPQVDLSRINDALVEAKRSKGQYSKALVSIADKFTSALNIFLLGKIDSISALDKVNDIISCCKTIEVNSANIEKVLRIVRTHNFLEFLCETIQKKEKSNELFDSLQQFQVFIKAVPTKFIPWLKTAYHYSEALSAIESAEWLRIIECSKCLEENHTILSSIVAPQEIDKKYEDIFLHLIKAKYLYGYNLAINLKAKDEAMKEESKSTTTVLSPRDIEKLKLQQIDASKLYGVTQLRSAGYSDSDIISIKIPLKYLWAFNFDPVLLRQNGMTVEKLNSAGYSIQELYQAGFSISQLRLTGCTIPEMISCGATVDQLKTAGYSELEIMEENLNNADSTITAEYDASKLVRMGVALQTLVSAGFTPFELRAAGFSASELRSAGFDNVKRLFEAGYDLQRLKSAGFDVLALKESGFSFASLKGAGFSEQCLLDSGFDKELERDALLELYNSTGGAGWRIRLNWNTPAPVSEWYGVTVDNNYNVIAIELCDNNLRGSLPESLWLLSKLKVLRLEHNQLRGSVPLLVLSRVRLNHGKADFSYNNNLEIPLLSSGRKNQFSDLVNVSTDSRDNSVGSPSPYNSPIRTVVNSLYQLNFDGSNNNNNNDNNNKNNNNEILNISSNGQLLFENNLTSSSLSEEKNEFEDIERSALLDFFNSTNGPRWANNNNWGNPLKRLRDWYGVTVNQHGQVTKLLLPSNNMSGCIPSSLSFLESLREIDFRLNQLHGSIPPSIGELVHLRVLYLHANKLSGDIPSEIGNLLLIGMIDLSNNQLTGKLHDRMSQLKQLKYFNVRSNKLKVSLKDINQLIPWSKNII